MPGTGIIERLSTGEPMLMDGGTGSEIQRRGANVLISASADSEILAWSATANVEYADVVQQVHQDYLRVGAEVIISNNFWATRSRLGLIGLSEQWEKYAYAAGENAIRARDAINPNAYVLGGIAAPYTQDYRKPYTQSDVKTLGPERYARGVHRPRQSARRSGSRRSPCRVRRLHRGLRCRRRRPGNHRTPRFPGRPAHHRIRLDAIWRNLDRPRQGPGGVTPWKVCS